MANVVEYVLKITGGKSPENIKKIAKQLKTTLKDLKKFGKQSTKTFNDFRKNSKKASEAIKGMQGAFTKLSIGIGGTTAAFIGMNKVIADSINEIVDASTRSGIATETLSGLRLAAEGSGKSFADLEQGLDSFSKKMLDATKGTGESAKMFSTLGISIKNQSGELRDSNSVFTETIKKLSTMENQTERNALVMKLFGRSGRALIQSGAIEDLDSFIGKAKELGPALDENGIQKAAEFQRGMADFKIASIGALQTIAEGITGEKGLGPSLSSLAEDLNNFAGGFKIFFQGLHDAFGGLLIFLDDLKGELEGVEAVIMRTFSVLPIEKFLSGSVAGFGGGAFQQRVADPSLQGISPDFLEKAKQFEQQLTDNQEKGIKTREERIKEGEKTKLAIYKETLKRRQEQIAKGDVKDFQAINTQILQLRSSAIRLGQSTKEVDLLFEAFKKLRSQTKGVDVLQFGSTGGGGGKPPPASTAFIDFQKKLAKNLDEATRAFERQQKEIGQANNTFLQLKKTVNAIGKTERPFQDVIDDLDETKKRFKELGQSTIPVIDLKMQVIELRREVEKLATTKTAINITTDIIGIAGGDILGGITGILQKTLKGPALELLGPVSGAIGGLVSFGQGMQQAADQAIAKREEKLGRKLTEEERTKLSDVAMRRKAEQDVKQFAMAIEVGLRMLPQILFEVLPPLFIDLGATIVKALLELPFRIGKAIIQGLFNTGAKIAEAPLNIMKGLADFFGLDSKRSGGRMISARRGLRFTGSSDTMAQLHRNEYVVPESGARPQAVERIMNQQSGSGINITINADIVERDAVETLVRKIEQRFQNFGTMQSTLFAG